MERSVENAGVTRDRFDAVLFDLDGVIRERHTPRDWVCLMVTRVNELKGDVTDARIHREERRFCVGVYAH